MIRRRLLLALPPLALAAALGAWAWTQSISATVLDLPATLSDQEYWRIVEQFSEPSGFFRSDNLVSNETTFQHVVPALKQIVRPGGVYLGVGPDQNFTYIAALRPRLAFIADIRRGNLHTQVMYKALFELAPDRAAFIALLFSRPRPEGVAASASADALFDAFEGLPADPELYRRNLDAIRRQLTETRGFRISADDLEGIAYVFQNFYAAGPDLAYASTGQPFNRTRYPSFRFLQTTTDAAGVNHAYLGSEDSYQRVRALQKDNLIVPIVGNFAGPKALRSVAAYLEDRGGRVTAFYTSNVEQYLFQDRLWGQFAENVMALPLDETSTFIRSCFNNCSAPYGSRSVTLLDSMTSLMKDYRAGGIRTYWDVLSHR